MFEVDLGYAELISNGDDGYRRASAVIVGQIGHRGQAITPLGGNFHSNASFHTYILCYYDNPLRGESQLPRKKVCFIIRSKMPTAS